MYIHNPYFRTAYRFMSAIFLLWGILLHFSCTDGDTTAHNFSFFTVQSNMLCFASLLPFLLRDLRTIRAGQHLFAKDTVFFDQAPFLELKFAATLCIIVTFLGNHAVVLFSHMFTGGILGLPMKSFLAHYVAPLLVTLDWLLFTPKGTLHAGSPLKWMFAPAFYLLFTAVRALCCTEETLARTGKYPYFFLNVDLVGTRIYIYLGIYFACFLIVGYLIFLSDLILSKIRRQK